jgi:hypothetical protein
MYWGVYLVKTIGYDRGLTKKDTFFDCACLRVFFVVWA